VAGGEADDLDDVARRRRVDDERRMLIGDEVPGGARGVPARVRGLDDLSAQQRAELGQFDRRTLGG
jgi:hypothetical protein